MERRVCRGDTGSGDGPRLTWAEGPDGRMVHVSQVCRGRACGCRCPGCGEALEAHQGAQRAHHFQHCRGAECGHALESMTHKLAKQVIDDERRLWLPPLRTTWTDRPQDLHPGGMVTLDAVWLEKGVDGFRPDVLARCGARELQIEVKVTHASTRKKLDWLRDTSRSTVEIELPRLDLVSPDALRDLVVRTAPRSWLHNNRLAAAEDAFRQKRADEIAARLRQPPRARSSRVFAEARSTCAALAAYGIPTGIGAVIPGACVFCVPSSDWQSVIVARLAWEPHLRPVWTIVDVLDWLKDCVHPEGRISDERLRELVRQHVPEFRAPQAVITSFLEVLERDGFVEREMRSTVGWRLHPEAAARIERQRQVLRWQADRDARLKTVRAKALAVLNALPLEDRLTFSLDDWMMRPVLKNGAQCPLDVIEGRNDAACEQLVSALDRLRGELVMHWTPADETTLGLPVAAERARRHAEAEKRRAAVQARQQEAERQRLERLRLEGVERVGHLRDYACRMLGSAEAEQFLATAWPQPPTRHGEPRSVLPTDIAAVGDLGLEQMKAAIWRLVDDKRRHEEAETKRHQAVGQRADLLRKAMLPQLRYDEDLVERFMTGRHPRLPGRQTPLEACATDTGFRDMVEVLRIKLGKTGLPG